MQQQQQPVRGRISAKWRAAYRAYKVGGKQQETNWKNRNEVVHGATRSENMQRQRDELCRQVTEAYEQFQDDPFIVSATHNSLFRRKPLEDRLKMGIDSLSAWLQSVKEARAYHKVFQATLQKAAKKFFVPRSSLPQSSTRSVKTDNIRRVHSITTPSTNEAPTLTITGNRQSTINPSDYDPG